MDLSSYLFKMRTSRGMTQGELARLLGISRVAVGKWEKGETANLKHDNLKKLAEIFDLSVDDILARRTERSEPRNTGLQIRETDSHYHTPETQAFKGAREKRIDEIMLLISKMDDYGVVALLEKAKDIARDYPLRKPRAS